MGVTIEEAVEILNVNQHRGINKWHIRERALVKVVMHSEWAHDDFYRFSDALIIAAWYQQRTRTNGVDLGAIVAESNRSRRRQDQEKLFPSLAEALRRESERVKELEVELAALRTPAVGSWQWALDQMKAGLAVKRPMQSDTTPIVCDRVARENGLLDIYYLVWSGRPQLAHIPSVDYEANDWQLAEEPAATSEAQPL